VPSNSIASSFDMQLYIRGDKEGAHFATCD
jgi:hypothetical protein